MFPVLQVRRMTGALVAVGQGQLTVAQLRDVLDAQDSLAYPQGLAAPAQGLFLTRVHYNAAGEEEAEICKTQTSGISNTQQLCQTNPSPLFFL